MKTVWENDSSERQIALSIRPNYWATMSHGCEPLIIENHEKKDRIALTHSQSGELSLHVNGEKVASRSWLPIKNQWYEFGCGLDIKKIKPAKIKVKRRPLGIWETLKQIFINNK